MRPMLASATPTAGEADGVSAADVPAGPEWLHEVKWDGMRVLVDVARRPGPAQRAQRVRRDRGLPRAGRPGRAAAGRAARRRGRRMVDGRPSFRALAERMHVQDRRRAERLAATRPVVLMVFDILRLYGVSLLDRPLDRAPGHPGAARRWPAPHWQVPPAYDDGAALLAATREQGLEGVVSKRRASTYQPGRRSKDWVKLPHRRVQSCLVGGWRPETGIDHRLGALLLGVPDGRRAGLGAGLRRPGRQRDQRARRPTGLAELLHPAGPGHVAVRDRAAPAVDAAGSHWSEPAGRGRGALPGPRPRRPAARSRPTAGCAPT